MSKLPTDLQILERIYGEYGAEFRSYAHSELQRDTRIYVPIDVEEIARRLDTDPEELFGRLHYHLNHKYSYKTGENTSVPLFSVAVGNDRHCVHFPYLAAILSEHREDNKRRQWSVWLSIASIIIATAAFLAQVAGKSA